MSEAYKCTFHENEPIIKFCLNSNCQVSPQCCSECISSKHKSHEQDCKTFAQISGMIEKNEKTLIQLWADLKTQIGNVESDVLDKINWVEKELQNLNGLKERISVQDYYEIKENIKYLREWNTIMNEGFPSKDRNALERIVEIITAMKQINVAILPFEKEIQNSTMELKTKVIKKNLFLSTIWRCCQICNQFIYVVFLFFTLMLLVPSENMANEQCAIQQCQCLAEPSNFTTISSQEDENDNDSYDDQLDKIDTRSQSYLSICETLYAVQDFQEAEVYCNRTIGLNTKSAKAKTYLGLIFVTHGYGALPQAIIFFEEAIQINPNYVEAIYQKCLTLTELQKNDDALQCFSEFLNKDDRNCTAMTKKSIILRKQKQYNESLASLNNATNLCPKYSVAHFQKGKVLQKLNDTKGAIESYDKVIKYEHRFANAYNNKGFVLLKLNEYDQALECFDIAISLQNENPLFIKNKCDALIGLKEEIEALECLQLAQDKGYRDKDGKFKDLLSNLKKKYSNN